MAGRPCPSFYYSLPIAASAVAIPTTAAACTKQPIETRYNWRQSERGKKDLFGTNLILPPIKPILAFPPRDQTRKSTKELTQLVVLFIQLSLQQLLVRYR